MFCASDWWSKDLASIQFPDVSLIVAAVLPIPDRTFRPDNQKNKGVGENI
jgi:hypothetical protein